MSTPVPDELARAGADVRPAGDGDAVGGQPARFVAEPASTAAASALLARRRRAATCPCCRAAARRG